MAEKAEGDYGTAEHLLSASGAHLEAVAFHCQQAVEKYLKALLVWRQIEFTKTHDIHLLLKLAATPEPDLIEHLAKAATLTPYGVEYRYPGDYPDVTEYDARTAFEIADTVRSAVLHHLPNDISK